MESIGLSNCFARVKEEPSDVFLSENDCGTNDEKPDLENFQLSPFPAENSTHTVQKSDVNCKIDLVDEVEIVVECEDVKPPFNLLKVDDISQNHLLNKKDTDGYETRNVIKIENASEVKQEDISDVAVESTSNFECEFHEKKFQSSVSKKFNNKRRLETHLDTKHKCGKKFYRCDICGKTFTQKGNVKLYIDSVHSGVLYSCDIRGKKFKRKNYLKIHMDSVHNGVLHSCDICEKTFVQKSGLKIHIDAAHYGITHTCKLCGKTFKQINDLNRHVQSSHQGIKYSCDKCEKKFTSKQYLKIHIDTTHNGITNACNICGKKFSTKGAMKIHIGSVHNSITHTCGYVGRNLHRKEISKSTLIRCIIEALKFNNRMKFNARVRKTTRILSSVISLCKNSV